MIIMCKLFWMSKLHAKLSSVVTFITTVVAVELIVLGVTFVIVILALIVSVAVIG